MTKRDQKRIVREWCDGMKKRLLRNVEQFPADWTGLHIRYLAALFAQEELDHQPTKRAGREMRRDQRWYTLPL